MKKSMILLAAAALMSSAVPSWAQMSEQEKNECLLTTKTCVDQVDDIQKRIHKLNTEVQKGTRVYTPEELKKLQQKLEETQKLIRQIETNPGGS